MAQGRAPTHLRNQLQELVGTLKGSHLVERHQLLGGAAPHNLRHLRARAAQTADPRVRHDRGGGACSSQGWPAAAAAGATGRCSPALLPSGRCELRCACSLRTSRTAADLVGSAAKARQNRGKSAAKGCAGRPLTGRAGSSSCSALTALRSAAAAAPSALASANTTPGESSRVTCTGAGGSKHQALSVCGTSSSVVPGRAFLAPGALCRRQPGCRLPDCPNCCIISSTALPHTC